MKKNIIFFLIIATFPFVLKAEKKDLHYIEIKEGCNDVVELEPAKEIDLPEPIPLVSFSDDSSERWLDDVTIGTYDFIGPRIARAPGSASTFFVTAYAQNGYVHVYKTSDGGYTWPTHESFQVNSVVNDASPDISVTPDYVFVVYETDGNIAAIRYNHSLGSGMSFAVSVAAEPEYYPAMATDAESYPSDAWLYIVWTADDANPGTEVYFRIWDTSWNPCSDKIGIFGAGSAYNYEYPDITFDNYTQNRVHTTSWQRAQNSIAYRGATSFGNSTGDWGSAFYLGIPSSGYEYRLPRIDSQNDRVLVSWERINSDVRAYFSYSTSGGINSGNFDGPYYFSGNEYWRCAAVIANTSAYWYLITWHYSGGQYWVRRLRSNSMPSTWYGLTISDDGYSLLPWYSFDGTTCGDNDLCVVWADGNGMWFDRETWPSSLDENPNIRSSPSTFKLNQNYPNPIISNTMIRYSLRKKAMVNLAIYDARGRKIETLINGEQESGYHCVGWDISSISKQNIPNGIYFYRLTSLNSSSTKKMVIMR